MIQLSLNGTLIIILSLILGHFISISLASPQFHIVNDNDAFGNHCKLPTYYSYPCPELCVRDIAMCPPDNKPPTCPEGTTYCVDSQCREICDDSLVSVCACPGAPALIGKVYSCGGNNLRTNIENFVVENKANQSAEACAKAANLQNIPNWLPNPKSAMWHQCPTPDYGQLTFTEPVFIALYSFYGSCFISLFFWFLFKKFTEKPQQLSTKKANEVHRDTYIDPEHILSLEEKKMDTKSKTTNSSDSFSDFDDNDTIIHAYKRNWLGDISLLFFILQTVGQVAFMILMTQDYYTNYSLFRGYGEIQASTFIGMWIKCNYAEGQYVQIERRQSPLILMVDQSDRITDFVRYLEWKSKRILGLDVVVTNAPLRYTSSGTKYFVYQCTRYVYHPESDSFSPHQFHLADTHAGLAALDYGLTSEEAIMREELIGPNFIEVYVPNFVIALFREFSSFFYIYQFTILWLFYYFAYWQVGIADTAVILVSALVKVIVRLRSEKRIKKMAEFTDRINILRDGHWQEKSIADLLPGDVFEVTEGKTTPCDGVILTGNIVADESSLTGEPLPIRKFPLRKDDVETVFDRLGSSKMSTIFSGTIISQAQPASNESRVTALVTHTGTATDKGELVKKILFPTHVSFIFDEQIKVVILILLCCGLLCLGLAIWMYAKGTSAWFYAMFAISQLVSPLLPAALVVGQSVAANRLKAKKIFCVDLPRILMAGKVQLFCFDKTGTLTKEGLEFFGAQPIKKKAQNKPLPEFDRHERSVDRLPHLVQIGLATCHAVTTLNGQFIGNPVDIEMFRSSGWQLNDHTDYIDTLTPPPPPPSSSSLSQTDNQSPIHVLKRYEFVHARMSMSVAVLDTATNKVHIFIKGAYEKIKELSHPDSIPQDYDRITANQAREGCYVLALAHREINLDQIVGGLDGFQQWKRDEMETDIHFLSLIIFKNQLKPDTSENIAELKRGDTRTIMITGDTALTGVYIARQCGMTTSKTSRVLLGDLDSQRGRVVWCDVDDPETFPDINVDHSLMNKDHTPVELAVTGKAFEWLNDHDLMRQYLLDTRVFARMTPNGKVKCVQLHMEQGITAMTGDGGNDCGALRAAHVGIAMSDAEASIVSPFNTSIRSVRSCVELIRQGRGALATSITGYKYLILYGQVMMMLKIFAFYFSVSMSEAIWIAIDVFITVLLTYAVSQSKAASNLSPHRPTARLLGPQALASGMGLVAINWIFLISAFVMLYKQDWFLCNEFDSRAVDLSKWMLLADNYEGEVLGIVCLYQFINNAAVFNFGYKFRQSFWRNYTLVCLWLLYLAIASYWTLADPNRFGCMFRFNCGTREVLEQIGYEPPTTFITPYNTPLGHNVMPREFRWKLWGLVIGNMITALTYERIVVLGPVHTYLAKRFPLKRLEKSL
ncbi:uncharacterized protein BX663DRAFT_552164 [Cokeromyces recurvatus]|uniref:uncharacterized protein n=1 Tax=Cokeromyces recurvatus TaxID=90255 RepID=UPI00222052A5|nr:uncharacterized protein BX663DRAFT_552164 [Cokeromyces recurvatus]KAI7902768.1 hypothetical protein BX663DRAFT_552164 [Cokeromyces recurvatus]